MPPWNAPANLCFHLLKLSTPCAQRNRILKPRALNNAPVHDTPHQPLTSLPTLVCSTLRSWMSVGLCWADLLKAHGAVEDCKQSKKAVIISLENAYSPSGCRFPLAWSEDGQKQLNHTSPWASADAILYTCRAKQCHVSNVTWHPSPGKT